jgi:hypothetical protein
VGNYEIVVVHKSEAVIRCPRCCEHTGWRLLDPINHPAPMPGEVFECGPCGFTGVIDREEVL